MNELTLKQIKGLIQEAEGQIYDILQSLQVMTGIPLGAISLTEDWWQDDDEDGEPNGKVIRNITGVKIEMDFNA